MSMAEDDDPGYEHGVITPEERKLLDRELSTEELHSMIKTLHYSRNGFTVAFSTLFNTIAKYTENKQQAYEAIERLSADLRKAVDHLYSGKMDNLTLTKDGVKVTNFSRNKLN